MGSGPGVGALGARRGQRGLEDGKTGSVLGGTRQRVWHKGTRPGPCHWLLRSPPGPTRASQKSTGRLSSICREGPLTLPRPTHSSRARGVSLRSGEAGAEPRGWLNGGAGQVYVLGGMGVALRGRRWGGSQRVVLLPLPPGRNPAETHSVSSPTPSTVPARGPQRGSFLIENH